MFSKLTTNPILIKAKTKLISVNKEKVVMNNKTNNNTTSNNNKKSTDLIKNGTRTNHLNGSTDITNINKPLEVRREEVIAIRNRFPTKIPIIVQRFAKEVQLPHLDKSKFLVPQEITMSQFQTLIRTRMKMNSNQALYLLVNNRSMLSLSLTLAQVYAEYAEDDGFLYITYASQEVFGSKFRCKNLF